MDFRTKQLMFMGISPANMEIRLGYPIIPIPQKKMGDLIV